jgi:transcriptional regulator with XRE-family HTH domain
MSLPPKTQSLGTFIRERRLALGLTQAQLAERIGDSLQQADVSRLERNHISLPRRQRLMAIAAALEVTLGELLVRTGWMEEDLIGESTDVAVDALPVESAWAVVVPKELDDQPLPELVVLLERISDAEDEVTAAGTALDTARKSVTAELRDQVDNAPSSNQWATDA